MVLASPVFVYSSTPLNPSPPFALSSKPLSSLLGNSLDHWQPSPLTILTLDPQIPDTSCVSFEVLSRTWQMSFFSISHWFVTYTSSSMAMTLLWERSKKTVSLGTNFLCFCQSWVGKHLGSTMWCLPLTRLTTCLFFDFKVTYLNLYWMQTCNIRITTVDLGCFALKVRELK